MKANSSWNCAYIDVVARQRHVGDEAQVRRVGRVDDAEAVAARLVGEDDVEPAVAAPELRPVAARTAGGEHVEQHRVRRVADVVGGDARAALVGGEDQQVAEQERMADRRRSGRDGPSSRARCQFALERGVARRSRRSSSRCRRRTRAGTGSRARRRRVRSGKAARCTVPRRRRAKRPRAPPGGQFGPEDQVVAAVEGSRAR